MLFHWLWPVGEGRSHWLTCLRHFCDEWASGGSGRGAEQKAGCAQCSEVPPAAAEAVGADWWAGGEHTGRLGPARQPQRSTGSPQTCLVPHHPLCASTVSQLGHVSSVQNEQWVILTSISVKDLPVALMCCPSPRIHDSARLTGFIVLSFNIRFIRLPVVIGCQGRLESTCRPVRRGVRVWFMHSSSSRLD